MTIKHSLLAATLALSGPAMAQDNYPSKAITLTVPNPPGGVVDTSDDSARGRAALVHQE